MLGRHDFGAFFGALHRPDSEETTDAVGTITPFPWQERLLDRVLDTGIWPERVVAPTGAGKTSVIDVHVFAQALAHADDPNRPPRRLSMVVDRRVLVDDQHDHARRVQRRLAGAPAGSVLAQVRAALAALRDVGTPYGELIDDRELDSPLLVARLRGGAPPSRLWRDYPTAAAVICATPDMWGSRLLFRGYGSSAKAWPREAGLLAVDSVVVVDEAHLARQLIVTARRVGQLARIGPASAFRSRSLQVVEATATPTVDETSDDQTVSIGVDDVDLRVTTLSDRLTRPKPLRLVEVPDWDNPRRSVNAVAALADEVTDLVTPRARTGGGDPTHTVGCFVNTVSRAVAVAQELRQRAVAGEHLSVVMICGQLRSYDLERLRVRHPGVLTVDGCRDVDVIVSTQSLEVGVDLDLAALVTELASGSAIAQRAGRVNRRGLRPIGQVVITVPDGALPSGDGSGITEKTRSGPYDDTELSRSLEWLLERERDPLGLAPWAVRENPPPQSAQRRKLFQRPELADAWHLARTSDQLAAEPDLDLWLADDFEVDRSAGLVVRDQMPVDSADAVRLISDLPPQEHEVFSVPLRNLRDVIQAWRESEATAQRTARRSPAILPEIVLVRGEEVGPLGWRADRDGIQRPRVRPGDIVIIDSSALLFTPSSARDVFSPPVLVSPGEALKEMTSTDDVLAADALSEVGAPSGRVTLRLEPPLALRRAGGRRPELDHAPGSVAEPWGALLNALSVDSLTLGEERDEVVTWLRSNAGSLASVGLTSGRALEVADRLARSASDPRATLELHVHRDADGPLRVIVRDRRRAAADEERRQEWLPTSRKVLLSSHQAHVGARAEAIARAAHLGDDLAATLRLAGEHHDDGKGDPRFQVRLRAKDADLLAKSSAGDVPYGLRRKDDRSGLPTNWRHEQLSVARSWALIHASEVHDPQLVARLIGTTHGHGRAGFPHTSQGLLSAGEEPGVAQEAATLFDEGRWDEVVERSQLRYGPWGCAYLEALLRAADGQVSMEGS